MSNRARPLILALAIAAAGCERRAATPEPIQAEPLVSTTTAGMAVPAPPPAVTDAGADGGADGGTDGGARAPEATGFSIECAGVSRQYRRPVRPSACLIRGRVRAVREVDTEIDHSVGFNNGHGVVRALEITLEPDDAVPCHTPLDPGETELRLPNEDKAHLEREGPFLVLGGARLTAALREGARLCGWTHRVSVPGLGYPRGWEGELADGSGLLGAGSRYLDRTESRWLVRAWQLSREGPVRRHKIDEGGAFVYHDRVRVQHGGGSALSAGEAEVILKGRDGAFSVTAGSLLTEGNTPVFVGHHDGFAFSAVRLLDARD